MCVVLTPCSSTAIEGNPLTLEQVRAVEEGREIPAVAARAKKEVVNYFAGLRFVEKNAADSTRAKLVLRPRQEQLLQLLRDHKSMKPREIWEALGVTKQGAIKLIRPLLEAALVRRLGTRKPGRYILA